MKARNNVVLVSLLLLVACKTAAPPKAAGGGIATGAPPGPAPAPLVGHNVVYNGDFAKGPRSLPWNGELSKPAAGRTFVDKGELCLEVTNRGINRWDAQLRHQHIKLQQGHTYSIQFKVRSTQNSRVYLKLGQAGPPFREYWKLLFPVEAKPQTYSGTFKMEGPDDPGVEMAFHIGGQLARLTQLPFTVCVDDIRVDDPQYVEVPEPVPPPIPNVLVNQVGYFPGLAKIAIAKNANAVPWQLLDAGGKPVHEGTTIPFGPDKASGDSVSVVDFTSFAGKGNGYTLKVAGDVSHAFDIREDLYSKLKYDALAFFYQQRSGIPIEMPYAGHQQWVRPAGHIDVKPNIGDTSVPCAPGAGCTYKLDVSGGWYDAGDQGKYVVNAGISVWTLLNWWERGLVYGGTADFLDGKMNIPENKNKVPDILDEARWELEFELKMQVPEGEKLAGMAHHKIHDAKWTQLSLGPHEDPMPRFLQPASTAATLNLAANAAQCARIWKKIDKAFSDKCLKAAERAWTAANSNPRIYAAKTGDGGGPYDDDHLDDEFYWAAAELYATTKKDAYKTFLEKSPHYKKVQAIDPGDQTPTPMTWGAVGTLGTITLATVPNGLAPKDIDDCKAAIKAAADTYVAIIDGQGYRVPFKPGKNGFPWGSNSFVLNNAIVMAVAADQTGDAKYVNAVAEGMNYILGRNPLDQSYITGYGERPLMNPHHRFWAHQANAKFPSPPAGVVSGGPNSGLQDPYVQAAGLKGCAPQKCFVDNIEAWSANEMAINWNAPLAWVAAFLDEKAGTGAGKGAGAGKKAAKK